MAESKRRGLPAHAGVLAGTVLVALLALAVPAAANCGGKHCGAESALGGCEHNYSDACGRADHDRDMQEHESSGSGGRGYGMKHGTSWNAENFPALGRAYQVSLEDGGLATIYFASDHQFFFSPGAARDFESPMLIEYTALPVDDDVYLIGWRDAKGQAMVATLDFDAGRANTFTALRGGSWRSYDGELTALNDFDTSFMANYTYADGWTANPDWPARHQLDWQQTPSLSRGSQDWRADTDYDRQQELREQYTSAQPAPYQAEGDVSGDMRYGDADDRYNSYNNSNCGAMLAMQLPLRNDLRRLWEDHITWTRMLIISAAGDLPDQQAIMQRLTQNQTDLGNAIKPYYGNAAGEQLSSLLKQHISTAAEVVMAAKNGDKAALTDAQSRMYGNADQIAAFLSQANPDNWPQSQVKLMFYQHLDLLVQEAEARLSGDWQTDAATFDQIHTQALQMADSLAEGIIAEFPDRFL